MENVLRLRTCHERNITFKQAFSSRGLVDDSIPLKKLTAKEEFSALVNWIIQELPRHEKMLLRADMEGVTYETTVHKDQYKIRVGEIKECGPGFTRYNWPEGLLYCSLDLKEIKDSIQRADMINKAVEIPQGEQAAEVSEISAVISNIPKIRMRETDENCWEVVLTEEERQLIDEFLQA